MGVGCRLRSQRRCGLAEPPPAVERRSRLATPLRGCACATRKAERLSVTVSVAHFAWAACSVVGLLDDGPKN